MTIKLQKFIDRWIGNALCALLALVVRRHSNTRIPAHPNTILVSKFFGIGSVALQLPLLRALRKQYPEALLVFMTFTSNRRLLELSGLCDEILTVRVSTQHFAFDSMRCLRRLRKLQPDLGIDLEFFSRYAQLMCMLSGAKYRIGLYREDSSRARTYDGTACITNNEDDWHGIVRGPVANNRFSEPANRRITVQFRWKHILDLYGEVAHAAGCEQYADTMIPVSLPEEARSAVRLFLTDNGWREGERVIAVNVNASELVIGRRWPAEKFAEVIEWLLRAECRESSVEKRPLIALTGTAAEFMYTESCRASLKEASQSRVINAAGKLSLDAFLALLTMCDLLITNDTGPLHLAALMRTPTVSLWGPGSPDMYGPRNTQHFSVYERYWCSPCMYLYGVEPGTFCNFTFPCVRGLEVERVKQAVEQLWINSST